MSDEQTTEIIEEIIDNKAEEKAKEKTEAIVEESVEAVEEIREQTGITLVIDGIRNEFNLINRSFTEWREFQTAENLRISSELVEIRSLIATLSIPQLSEPATVLMEEESAEDGLAETSNLSETVIPTQLQKDAGALPDQKTEKKAPGRVRRLL